MMRLMVEADVRGRSAETFDAIFGKSLLDYWNCLLKFHVGFERAPAISALPPKPNIWGCIRSAA